MRKIWTISMAIFAITLNAKSSPSAEINVQTVFFKETSDTKQVTAVVWTGDKAKNLVEKKGELEFVAKPIKIESTALWTRFVLSMENLPVGYSMKQIDIDLPFNKLDRNINITLVATNAEPGNREEVSWLRSVDPNKIDGGDLFVYHARARIQAEYYLKRSLTEETITRDAVKSIYSYLQSTRELSKENFVLEDDRVASARSWLENAIENAPTTVDSAVKVENAKQAIDQVDGLARVRYDQMWKAILALLQSNKNQYCTYMGIFQSRLRALPASELEVINTAKLSALVANAFAACIADAYIRDVPWESQFNVEAFAGNEMTARELFENQISYLQEQLELAQEWPGLRAQVESHLVSMREIVRSLQ